MPVVQHSNEPVTYRWHSVDVARIPGIILEQFADLGYRTRQRIVGNRCALPNRLEDLLLAQNAFPILNQELKQAEGFCLEHKIRGAPTDSHCRDIYRNSVKLVNLRRSPRTLRRIMS